MVCFNIFIFIVPYLVNRVQLGYMSSDPHLLSTYTSNIMTQDLFRQRVASAKQDSQLSIIEDSQKNIIRVCTKKTKYHILITSLVKHKLIARNDKFTRFGVSRQSKCAIFIEQNSVNKIITLKNVLKKESPCTARELEIMMAKKNTKRLANIDACGKMTTEIKLA